MHQAHCKTKYKKLQLFPGDLVIINADTASYSKQ